MSSYPLFPETYDREEVNSIRDGNQSILTVRLSGNVSKDEAVSDINLTLFLNDSHNLRPITISPSQVVRSSSGVILLFDVTRDCLGDDYRSFIRQDAFDMVGGSILGFLFGCPGSECRYEFAFEPEKLFGKFRWKAASNSSSQ